MRTFTSIEFSRLSLAPGIDSQSSTWAALVCGFVGAIANQPLCQCTVVAATTIVNISGILTKRVNKPISKNQPPKNSLQPAKKANKSGNGNPKPHSLLPNH